MKYIKIIENNINVSSIVKEVHSNNHWKRNLELVKAGKINCMPNRATKEKDIILVSGPYYVGKSEEHHSHEDWVKCADMYDNPSVEFRKTEFFEHYPLLMEYLYSKFPSLRTELVRIIISKLYPGDKVVKHHDFGRSYRKNRFHFSIQGTYKYYVADEEITITPGTLFWFDNKQLHWAENVGENDRISVIFDIDPNYCKDFALPVNHYRYINNLQKDGVYFCNDIDKQTKLYLHEKQI